MRTDRHLIQRQVIELAIGGFEGAGVQNALAQSYWQSAVPALERLFDSIAGPDESLRLDRLEIDLGLLSGSDWQPQFRIRLIDEMTRALASHRLARNGERNASQAVPPAVPLQQFLYFLVHGRLPWWGGRPRLGWSDLLSPTMDAAGWAQLQRVLVEHVHARTRCVDSVSDEFLEEAFARWTQVRHANATCEALVSSIRSGSQSTWRRQFWYRLLGWAATGANPVTGPELMRELLAVRHSMGLPETTAASEVAGSALESPSASTPRGEAETSPRAPAGSRADLQWHALPEPWRQWAELAARAPHARTDAPQAPRPRPVSKPVTPSAGSEPIYLGGAGAILLHPFLETLFRERGLLTGRQFNDDCARDRAIQLVGLLCFGERAPEYDLLLAKLLCGCPLEQSVEPVEPDEEDRAACDALLTAVLQHWSALRSGSAQWLREQFLLREGKIEPVDGGWRLTVESRAQDVLLARLPWGFGVVSPPWLTERIFVQWAD